MHLLRPVFGLDRAEALDFAAKRGFGMLVAFDGAAPRASHLPFTLHRENDRTIVTTHVTAANPLAGLAEAGASFLLAVTGPDVYVSNDDYATPDQVSTWLYEAVHLTGPARLLDVPSNRAHGDALLAVAEGRMAPKQPWTLATMEPGKRAMMLDGIRVIRIEVERVESQRKLNQHKPDIDHVSVVRALRRRDDAGARAIAAKMQALRPGLEYD
jgi:transcriptional regulator